MKVLMFGSAQCDSQRFCGLLREARYDVTHLPSVDDLCAHHLDGEVQLVIASPSGHESGGDVLHILKRVELAGAPVLFLAAGTSDSECITALCHGADDAVRAGITGGQFLKRVRRMVEDRRPIVRREDAVLRFGPYVIDPLLRRVTCAGVPLQLSPREFALAWQLFTHLNRTVTNELLLARIWGSLEAPALRSLRSHMHRVRQELQPGLASGVMLRTVYATGYRLEWFGDPLLSPGWLELCQVGGEAAVK